MFKQVIQILNEIKIEYLILKNDVIYFMLSIWLW